MGKEIILSIVRIANIIIQIQHPEKIEDIFKQVKIIDIKYHLMKIISSLI
jgi:hypothetical protein